jgi:hypothetical protein
MRDSETMKTNSNIASLHRIVGSEIANRNTDPLCYSLAMRSFGGQSEADVLKEYVRIRLQGLVSLREKRKAMGKTALLRDVEIRRERDLPRERKELALSMVLTGATWIAVVGAYLAFRLRAAGDFGTASERIGVIAAATILCALPQLYRWFRGGKQAALRKADHAIHSLAMVAGAISFYCGITLLKSG